MDKGTFAYALLKHLGNVSDDGVYSKQLNLIRYGVGRNKRVRLDLRTWVQTEGEGEKMCKGICLTREEAEKLFDLLGQALVSDDVQDLLGASEEGKEEA